MPTRGGGGWGSPLFGLYGDVLLDRVWFFGLAVLNRVYNLKLFDLALPYTGSEPVLNRVWYYEPRDFNPECEQGLMVFCSIQVQRHNYWVLDASNINSLI